jgi:hypothetical protein
MAGGTRRWRAAIIGLTLLIGSVGAAPVAAVEATSAALVLKGASSAYVDVEFSTPFTPLDSEVAVSTEGTYAGYAIYGLENGLRSGLVSIPAFDRTGQPFGPATFTLQRELPAGLYRVYLIADGESKVQVPVDGLAQRLRLRPETPARIDAGVVDLATFPLIDHGAARVPVELGQGNWLYMAALQVVEHHQASRMSVCAAAAGGDCLVHDAGPGSSGVYSAPSLFPGYFLHETGGTAREGLTDLLFDIDGVGVSKALLGFYFVMHP